MIIYIYLFCEIRGLYCFKKIFHYSKDCYDKTLIKITKENQTQREKRKTIFSKLIENYSKKILMMLNN
jgi:hypothetical protein